MCVLYIYIGTIKIKKIVVTKIIELDDNRVILSTLFRNKIKVDIYSTLLIICQGDSIREQGIL